jgi:hypothetical protein
MEVIEQKCRKAYPGYFTLVVHARNEKTTDLGIVSQAISRLRVPFAEIWALRQASPTIFKVLELLVELPARQSHDPFSHSMDFES